MGSALGTAFTYWALSSLLFYSLSYVFDANVGRRRCFCVVVVVVVFVASPAAILYSARSPPPRPANPSFHHVCVYVLVLLLLYMVCVVDGYQRGRPVLTAAFHTGAFLH